MNDYHLYMAQAVCSYRTRLIGHLVYMRLSKVINRSIFGNILTYIVGFLLYIIGGALFLTCRRVNIQSAEVETFLKSHKPSIYAIWHGRMFPTPFMRPRGHRVYAVISRNTDGNILAVFMKLLGVYGIRGSSNFTKPGFVRKNRGGTQVIRQSIDVLNAGHSIVVTPDGPRGPIYKIKPGFVKVAAATGKPIFPVAVSCNNAWVFRSWDKFMLPKPFSTIKLVWGSAVYIPQLNSDEEAKNYSKEIETILVNMTTELDKEFELTQAKG